MTSVKAEAEDEFLLGHRDNNLDDVVEPDLEAMAAAKGHKAHEG